MTSPDDPHVCRGCKQGYLGRRAGGRRRGSSSFVSRKAPTAGRWPRTGPLTQDGRTPVAAVARRSSLGTTVVANVTPALAEREAAHNVHVQTLQGAKWKLGGQYLDEPKEKQKEEIVDFTVAGPRRSGRKRKPVVPLVSVSPPQQIDQIDPRKG